MFYAYLYILALVYTNILVTIDASVIPKDARKGCRTGRAPLLVLSFDGIGADDTQKALTCFNDYNHKAASVNYLKSVFPTKTFSTHFSVATGVTPAFHGVIGNEQFDKYRNKVRNHPHQYRYVPDINPIWVENQDGKYYSGTMMWPGAQFQYRGNVKDNNKIFNSKFVDDGNDEDEELDGTDNDDDNYENGKKAEYNISYEPKSMEWNKRVDTIIEWLKHNDKPANLVMAYFEDYGSLKPGEKEDSKTKHGEKVNTIIKYIHDQLKLKGLDDQVDIILMSDHGTNGTKGDDILVIDDLVTMENKKECIISSGPLVYIIPDAKDYFNTIAQLKSKSEDGKKYKVYTKPQLKWDMDQMEEILPQIITVVANPTYTFYTKENLEHIKKNHGLEKDRIMQEVNGYDNDHESMNGFFYALGPSFKNDVHLGFANFNLEEVYPLIKVLIGLKLTNSSSVQDNNDLDSTVQSLLEPHVNIL